MKNFADLLPCEIDPDEQFDAPLGDDGCRFRANPLHVCTDRDGHIMDATSDKKCWQSARVHLLTGGKR
jgi:hypothetical protein